MRFLNRFRIHKKIQLQNVELESEPLVISDPPWPASVHNVAYSHDPAGWIADRFEVFETRVGGMGLVYLCLDHQKDIPVALKTFRPEYLPDRAARDRFLREGTIWVDLGRHSHIVRCFEVFAPGVGPEVYLVLELIAPAEGKEDASLRSWLGRNQPLSSRQSLLFTLHIMRGMRHATVKKPGLVHRDLKPENILVGPDSVARITDFGLASVLLQLGAPVLAIGKGEGIMTRTQLTQDFVGTPLYMAPEQWISGETLDARADIYAVGCILYEMLTAKTAVSGRNLAELEYAHRSGRIRAIPPDVPRELASLVHRCITPDRENRYQTWEQMESALERVYRILLGEDVPVAPGVEAETREERMAAAWSYQIIGDSYSNMGKYEVAQRYFEKTVRIGREEKHLWLEGAGLGNLGMVLLRKGEAQQAIKVLVDALAIARETHRTEEVAILTAIGNAHRDCGDMQRALEYYEQALAFARAREDRPYVGAILNSMGNLHRRSGRLEQATDLYEQALPIMEEIGDRAGMAMILAHLGICYRRLQDTGRAIALFERALDISCGLGDRDGEGRALANLANAYSDLGDVRRSIDFSRQALTIAQETGNKRAEGTALGNLGLDFQNLGDFPQAMRYCEQALSIAREIGDVEGLARASSGLAMVLGESYKPSEALQHAKVALEAYEQIGHERFAESVRELIDRLENQSTGNAQWSEGVAHVSQEQLDEAIGKFQREVLANPDLAEAHYKFGVAMAYYPGQRYKNEAIQELETALRLDPDLDAARRNLSDLHYQLPVGYGEDGNLQAAVGEYQAAIRVDPNNFDAHVDLGIALAESGYFEHAIEEYRTALRLKPDAAKAHDGLGVVFLRLGQSADALREFRQAAEVDPNYPGAHFNLAGIYWQQGRLSDAIHEYRVASSLDPGDVEAHHNLGMIYSQQNLHKEAVGEFKAAIHIDPEDARAYYCLGLVYRDQGLQSEAVREFQNVLLIDPTHADARLNLANSYMQQGHLDEAVREYHTVVASKPDHAEAHVNLGIAYEKQGRASEAFSEYQAALHISPDSTLAHYNLGLAYARRDQWDAAIREWQSTVRNKPDHANARYNLGIAYEQHGWLDKAIQEYHSVLQIEPNHVGAHLKLGIVYAQQGRVIDAIGEFREAARIDPACADAHHNLGLVYGQLGRITDEIREYQAALHINPNLAQTHHNLGLTYYHQGQWEEAVYELRLAAKLGHQPAQSLLASLGYS